MKQDKTIFAYSRRPVGIWIVATIAMLFVPCCAGAPAEPQPILPVRQLAPVVPAAPAPLPEPVAIAHLTQIAEPVVIEPQPAAVIELPPVEEPPVELPVEPTPVELPLEPPVENIDLIERLLDPALADELITVDFNRVDIRMVLETIGELTDINFIPHDQVQGEVTVISPSQIRMADLYSFLESILAVKGYAAIPMEDFVKIVPRSEAAQHNIKVRIGADLGRIDRDDSFVTQIIPLRYADSAEVSGIIRNMLPSGSQMAVYPRTNTIMITDTSSNIYHIVRIINRLDVPGAREDVATIPLKYASAVVLSKQITEIIEQDRNLLARPGRSGQVASASSSLRILPDGRTNSLIVVANAQDMANIKRIAATLDVERPSGTTNVNVVPLENALAEDLAVALSAALSNLQESNPSDGLQQPQINADKGTNSLIVTASSQDYETIKTIISQLDIELEHVYVELVIMEVGEDVLREIGIDWATLDGAVSGNMRAFAETNFGPRVDYLSGTLEGLGVGAWKHIGSSVGISAILKALEKVSGVNILSTPQITASNHKPSKITVVDNIPYLTESRITETDPSDPTVIKTFGYKDVGITLDITPHISQGGMVRLEIDSTFSKLIDSVTGLGNETPTTASRTVQTALSMKSETTIVIGGLIRDDTVTLENKIPLLGDIPLLGELFKWKRDRIQKTNLLIFITPTILDGSEAIEAVTEQKRREMDQLTGVELSSDTQPLSK